MKTTTYSLKAMKADKKKVAMLTAYDYQTAGILDEAGIDIALVGDSVGNVMLGYENTIPVTVDEMLHHTKAVSRAVKNAMVITDMPFMSYQLTPESALLNASRFVKEAGAHGVKIEGDIYSDAIDKIIKAGIPVMGHLGLTPQLVNQLGGYRVQGRSVDQAKEIFESAKKLENLGVFAVVLEMVPALLAKKITQALSIPVIGCGAGPYCDGQVLVVNDILGLSGKTIPRFAKKYTDLYPEIKSAVSTFISEVKSGIFPGSENSF